MELINTFAVLLAMATITQYLVDRIKAVLPAALLRVAGPPVWSLAVAAALAFMFNLDVFRLLGLQTGWNIMAKIFTGLAISAGADPLHNLFARLRELRNQI